MHIAQVAPLYESVPPLLYEATEHIVCYRTEELVRLGHRVTLFASADSRTSAELVPTHLRETLHRPADGEDYLAVYRRLLHPPRYETCLVGGASVRRQPLDEVVSAG